MQRVRISMRCGRQERRFERIPLMFDKQRLRPILLAGAIAGCGGRRAGFGDGSMGGGHGGGGGHGEGGGHGGGGGGHGGGVAATTDRGPRAATRRPARSAKNFARLLDGLQPSTDLSTNREHRDRSETLRMA